MTSHDAFREIAASYALNALDERERLEFEAHLVDCEICKRELAELAPVVLALGQAVEKIEPPAELKAKTLARAVRQPQSRPRVFRAAVPRPAPVPVTRTYTWLPAAAGFVLAAGLALYAAALRTEVVQLRQMAAEAYARADELRDELTMLRQDSARLTNTVNVLSGADTIKVDLRGAAGAPAATGRAYVSTSRGLVFAANRLPPLSPGRVYQLWVIPPGSAVPLSAGVFSVDATGSTAPLALPLPVGTSAARTVAVTDEPAPAGSALPSTPILLAGSVGD